MHRWVAGLAIFSIAVVGCSSGGSSPDGGSGSTSGSSGSSGTTGSSSGGAGARGRFNVEVATRPMLGELQTSVLVLGHAALDGGAPPQTVQVENCLITRPAPGANRGAPLEAGDVIVSGPTLAVTFLFHPEISGGFYLSAPGAKIAVDGGDVLHVAASGGVVPAFALSAVAPSTLDVNLNLPPLDFRDMRKLDRGSPYTVTWSGASTGPVVTELTAIPVYPDAGEDVDHLQTATCSASPADGHLTLSPTVLAQLQGHLMVSTYTLGSESGSAGPYDVSFSAKAFGKQSDGRAAEYVDAYLDVPAIYASSDAGAQASLSGTQAFDATWARQNVESYLDGGLALRPDGGVSHAYAEITIADGVTRDSSTCGRFAPFHSETGVVTLRIVPADPSLDPDLSPGTYAIGTEVPSVGGAVFRTWPDGGVMGNSFTSGSIVLDAITADAVQGSFDAFLDNGHGEDGGRLIGTFKAPYCGHWSYGAGSLP